MLMKLYFHIHSGFGRGG